MKWVLGIAALILVPAVVVAGLLMPTASIAAAQECLADPGPIADPGVQADGVDNATYIWRALRADGLSEAAAAGVLGNLQQESRFDPTLQQAGGPGVGIAQWSRGGRWDGQGGLVPWARAKDLDEWSLRTQVLFLLKEMHDGWGGFSIGRFRRYTDPVEATIYFHDTYERSADSAADVRDGRGRMAVAWLRELGGTAVAARPAGVSVWIAGDRQTKALERRIRARYAEAGSTATIVAGATVTLRTLPALLRSRQAQTADAWMIALDPAGADLRGTVLAVLAAAGRTRQVTWLTSDPAAQRVLADLADVHTNLTVSRDTSLAAYDPPVAAASPADIADPNCEVTSSGGQMVCPDSRAILTPDRLKPNATQVARCVAAGWPAIDTIGGWRPSDPYPDHPSGQAVDIMMPQGCSQTTGELAMGKQIVTYLAEHAEEFKIVYMLWQQQIWKITEPRWEPASSNGNCTADHVDHIHVATWEPGGVQLGGGIRHPFRRSTSPMRPCPPRFACGVGIGTLRGTPGQIVDAVITWAASQGAITGPGEKMSVPAVWRANDSHGSTVNGGRSDHQGPPEFAWAVDIFDPADPHGVTRRKDRMAAAIAAAYGFEWNGSGLVSLERGEYRLQLIYRTNAGGNHFNHIHFGVRQTDMREPPVPRRLVYRGPYQAPRD